MLTFDPIRNSATAQVALGRRDFTKQSRLYLYHLPIHCWSVLLLLILVLAAFIKENELPVKSVHPSVLFYQNPPCKRTAHNPTTTRILKIVNRKHEGVVDFWRLLGVVYWSFQPVMAYMSRPTSMLPPGSSGTSLRQPSNHGISQQQSSALTIRIASKKAELEHLRQLRDLSATLATQMQTLEAKIGTLNDGTEGLLMQAICLKPAHWYGIFSSNSSGCVCSCELGQCTTGHQYGVK